MRTFSKVVAAPIVCFLVLQVLIFSRMMNFEVRRDEQLYVPPAQLLSEYHLYSDLFYNHTPGSAWLFYGVMTGLGTDYLLLAARLGVFAAWAAFGIALIAITYKLTRSAAMTCLAVILIMANEALLNQTGMTATNNLLPVAAGYLGLGFFMLGVADGQGRPMLVAASGLALSTAAVFKANAFVFIPIIAVASLFLPRQALMTQRLKWVVAPLVIGGLVGALPVFFYLAADPERFLAHVIGFHTGPHVAYWATQIASDDETVAMSAGPKAQLAYSIWFNAANLLFIFTATFLLVCLAMSEPISATLQRLLNGRILVTLVCLFAAGVMSFVPTPGFPQYFALPLVCAPLLLALLYAELDEESRRWAQPALVAASMVILLAGSPRLGQYALRLASPNTWSVERIHNAGKTIARLLAEAGVSGKVATLAPIYPLEGGLQVYPELATGQFAYRTAELTNSYLRDFYRTTSPREVEAFLAADPPAGILVGFDSKLEEPLVRFAQQNGYRQAEDMGISDRYGKAVLYIRANVSTSN